jgi:hypothetical protein
MFLALGTIPDKEKLSKLIEQAQRSNGILLRF